MSAVVVGFGARQAVHPNPLDLKRIERSLKSRKRYRYVKPSVRGVDGGYRIESPCCSRNIDPDGGVIDVVAAPVRSEATGLAAVPQEPPERNVEAP